MRAIATWACVGAAAGAWLGLLDATLVRTASLRADPGVFPVGVMLGAGVGLVVGLVVVLLVRRTPIGPLGPALLAVAGLGAGLGAPRALSARADVAPTVADATDLYPNVLLVTVPGLAEAVAAGRSPAWSALGRTGIRFPQALASVPDVEDALAGVITGRLPPGREAAGKAPTLLGLGAAAGYRTLVVVPEDASSSAALAPDAGAWRVASDADPLRVGLPSAGLVVTRVLGPRLGRVPRPATPERAVSEARGWLEAQAGHPWIAVVQLPGGPTGSVEASLVGLLAAAEAASRGRALGIVMLGQPAGPGLAPADLATPALLRLPDSRFGGVVVTGPVSALDLGETARRWLPAVHAPVDGSPWGDVRLAKAAVAVTYDLDPELVSAASGGDPGRACKLLYPNEGALPVVSMSSDGTARVARNGGYALYVDAAGRRLIDEVADPGAPRDLLAERAVTCTDQPAEARADALQKGLDAVLATSREQGAAASVAAAPR